ncbi:MAG: FAD-dependent oxidoreductase [bacterium]
MKKPETTIPKPIELMTESKMPLSPVSIATMEHRNTGLCRTQRPVFVECVPACQSACPTASDVESWIRLLQAGKTAEAYEAATVENPFPAITGRVCTHPCTTACNRGKLGGAVNIKSLERTVGDSQAGALPAAQPFFKASGRKIAVVGSGPAGLACAYHSRRMGHDVIVFEGAERAGGMLRYGLPSFRLPKEILDREIARLASMGVEVKTSKPVPDATHMQSLRQEYNAVYIAIGSLRAKTLGLGEEHVSGVIPGLSFLKGVSEGHKPKLGKKVVVVGGCNTSIDAARTALRLGAEVTVIFAGPRDSMSAFAESIDAALEEGVKIEEMTEAVKVLTAQGRASAVACRKDASEIEFAADTVIAAPGERIDTSIIPSSLHVQGGSLIVDETGRTEWLNVFAGGDFTGGPHSVVHALAAGKRTAIAIDCLLRGEGGVGSIEGCSIEGSGPALISRYVEKRLGSSPARKTIGAAVLRDKVVRFEDLNSAYFADSAPFAAPRRNAKASVADEPFAEIEGPLDAKSMAAELARCFHCGRCTECGNCYIYCPDLSIAKRDGGYDLDLHHCKGCGICKTECPRAAIEMASEEKKA